MGTEYLWASKLMIHPMIHRSWIKGLDTRIAARTFETIVAYKLLVKGFDEWFVCFGTKQGSIFLMDY